MKARRTAGWLIVVVVGALAVVGWTRSTRATGPTTEPSTVGAPPPSIPDLVSRLSPSVVTISTTNGIGSGVVWSRDGIIVTANHVVTGSTQVSVELRDGSLVGARVLAGDPITDLAVVKADRAGLQPATFATTPPRVGVLAVAMGSPLGFANTASAGIVSGMGRSMPGTPGQSPTLLDLLQTDANISPGDSGGALVDDHGQVIGINEAYIPPAQGAVSIGFATPATIVNVIVPQLLQSGKARHPYFGAQLSEVAADTAQQSLVGTGAGVIVNTVVTGGPAARAAIKVGDLITTMDKTRVPTVVAFITALRSHRPGDVVTITIMRGTTTHTTDVTLTEQPS
jgi:S1-C subfamily serine protease